MELQDLTQLKNLKEMVDYAAENYGDRIFMEYKDNGGISKKTYADLRVLKNHSFFEKLWFFCV